MTKQELQIALKDYWNRGQVDTFAYLALESGINQLDGQKEPTKNDKLLLEMAVTQDLVVKLIGGDSCKN